MKAGDSEPSRCRCSSTLGQAWARATAAAGNCERSAWKEAAIRRRLLAAAESEHRQTWRGYEYLK